MSVDPTPPSFGDRAGNKERPTTGRDPSGRIAEGNQDADAAGVDGNAEPGERNSLQLLWKQLRDFFAALTDYATSKSDSFKLTMRVGLQRLVLGVIAIVAVCGLIITATWFVLRGVADGLGIFLGGRQWLATLATGLLTLVLVAIGTYLAIARANAAAFRRTVRKHELRQSRQHTHRRDAGGRAAPNAEDDQ